MEIVFSHPNYLWFLISIPVLIAIHFLSLKYTSQKALKFANFPAIEKATGDKLTSKNLNALISRIIIVTFAILAAAGSTLLYTATTTESDFVLAIDSSSSMLASDYSPNRLDAAKNAAALFIDYLPARTKVGVVSFAGTTFVDVQPTEDKGLVTDSISNLQAKRVGGTDIGEAIITSTNLLTTAENPKVVILITDGRTNVGEIIDQAIAYANINRVTVNTIGIGTIEGGRITEDVTLTLDEETLKKISQETSGIYLRAENNQQLEEAYRNMAELTRKKVSINLTVIFLFIVIVLLFVEWSLINTKFKILP